MRNAGETALYIHFNMCMTNGVIAEKQLRVKEDFFIINMNKLNK